MSTGESKINVVLATTPLGNYLLSEWLGGHGDLEVLAVAPGEPEGWRVDLYRSVRRLLATGKPIVVILSPARSGEVLGTCLQLLDIDPSLIVLAVPLEVKGERVAVVYRRVTTVEEVEAVPFDNLLTFIRAASRGDSEAKGGEAQ